MCGTDLNSPFSPQVTYIYPWPNVPVNLVRACERRLQGCEDIGPGAGLPAENLDLPHVEQKCPILFKISKNSHFHLLYWLFLI